MRLVSVSYMSSQHLALEPILEVGASTKLGELGYTEKRKQQVLIQAM